LSFFKAFLVLFCKHPKQQLTKPEEKRHSYAKSFNFCLLATYKTVFAPQFSLLSSLLAPEAL
jgi:hypothetical protein